MIEHRYSKPLYGWCLTGLILTFLLLLSAGVYTRLTDAPPEIFKFLGRFHPVSLHFPVGLVPALLLIELYAIKPHNRGVTAANMIVLAMAVVTGTVAACTGLLLGEDGSYDAELFDRHKQLGAALALVLLVGGFLRLRHYRTAFKPHLALYWLTLLAAAVLTVLAGHDGGSLTHGKTFLTEHQPEWLDNIVPVADHEEQSAPKVDAEGVFKIFEEKCYSCHGVEKQKGDYRMDTEEHAFTAGESERTPIVPGQAMKSYLVELITLPLNADEVMPPDGKEQLTPQEIVDIIYWVNAGAPWQEAPATTNPPPAEAAAVVEPAAATNTPAAVTSEPVAATNTSVAITNTLPAAATNTPPATATSFALNVLDPSIRILEPQADTGILLSESTPNAFSIALAPETYASMDSFDLAKALAPVKEGATQLNLSHAQLSADAWKELANLPNLKGLHAPFSNISDADLDALTGLTGLTYLNLHGTAVTDSGAKKLGAITNLKHLYLGMSEVTETGAMSVDNALSNGNVYYK